MTAEAPTQIGTGLTKESKDLLRVFSPEVRKILTNPRFLEILADAQTTLRETGRVDQSLVVWGERIQKNIPVFPPYFVIPLIWQDGFPNITFGEVFANPSIPSVEEKKFTEGILSSDDLRKRRPILAYITLTSQPEDPKAFDRDTLRHAELTHYSKIARAIPFITVSINQDREEVDIEVANLKPFTKLERRKDGTFYLVSSNPDSTIIAGIPRDRDMEDYWPLVYNESFVTVKPSKLERPKA